MAIRAVSLMAALTFLIFEERLWVPDDASCTLSEIFRVAQLHPLQTAGRPGTKDEVRAKAPLSPIVVVSDDHARDKQRSIPGEHWNKNRNPETASRAAKVSCNARIALVHCAAGSDGETNFGVTAQFEFTFAAIAQNLRRLGKLVARPPLTAVACVA